MLIAIETIEPTVKNNERPQKTEDAIRITRIT